MISTKHQRPSSKGRGLRSAGVASILVLAMALSGCGGGVELGTFDISVLVAGQPMSGDFGPANSPTVYVRAGQSFELDAHESAIWTLYVGGSAIRGTGAAISYAGADVRLTAVSPSRIAVDTYAAYRLNAPVAVTLVAISTYDAAQVATINVLITN